MLSIHPMSKRDPVKDLADALDAATKNLVRQRSHFSYSQLLYETFLEAPSRAIDPKTIPEAVQQHIKNDESILKLGGVDGQTRYTTTEMLYPNGGRQSRLLPMADPLLHEPASSPRT